MIRFGKNKIPCVVGRYKSYWGDSQKSEFFNVTRVTSKSIFYIYDCWEGKEGPYEASVDANFGTLTYIGFKWYYDKLRR